jgi:hypothetical protein
MLTLVNRGRQRGLATARQLGCSLVMTCMAFDGALSLVPSAMLAGKT